ncbi:MAG: hypothetical protein QOI24_1295 [Acidobacteriota bacterium]|nr:hypothetical protein [Acidobacteriota bacterium]
MCSVRSHRREPGRPRQRSAGANTFGESARREMESAKSHLGQSIRRDADRRHEPVRRTARRSGGLYQRLDMPFQSNLTEAEAGEVLALNAAERKQLDDYADTLTLAINLMSHRQDLNVGSPDYEAGLARLTKMAKLPPIKDVPKLQLAAKIVDDYRHARSGRALFLRSPRSDDEDREQSSSRGGSEVTVIRPRPPPACARPRRVPDRPASASRSDRELRRRCTRSIRAGCAR